MKEATFDPARRLDLYFRCSRAGSKNFVFAYSDGSPYSFIYQEFQFNIYRYEGEKKVFLNLLTVSNQDTLTSSITVAQSNIQEGQYYYELFNDNTDETWLCGDAIFHNGKFDGVTTDTTEVTIQVNGEVINITVEATPGSGAGGSGTVHVDGITIQGDGSEANPLNVPEEVFDIFGAAAAAEASAQAYTDDEVAQVFEARMRAVFYGDFGAMLAPYVNSATGTGATAAISSIAGTAGNPGTATCQTGSTSTGQAYLTLSASFNNFLLGGGSWIYESVQYINVLSTSSERFVVVIGYHDSPSTSDATDGCYFRYADNVNSGNWQCITRSNSVETGTVTNTAVPPVAATYQRFRIEVNAAGTLVTYFINGTQVAQHNANIPTGSGRQSTWCTGIRKTVGNTAMSIIVDYMNVVNELTVAR